jgi:hypothetical protein
MMDTTISMLTTYRGNNNVGVLLLPDSYWRWPEITNHLPHYYWHYYCIVTENESSLLASFQSHHQRDNRRYSCYIFRIHPYHHAIYYKIEGLYN